MSFDDLLSEAMKLETISLDVLRHKIQREVRRRLIEADEAERIARHAQSSSLRIVSDR
jgi:hypothetical protein